MLCGVSVVSRGICSTTSKKNWVVLIIWWVLHCTRTGMVRTGTRVPVGDRDRRLDVVVVGSSLSSFLPALVLRCLYYCEIGCSICAVPGHLYEYWYLLLLEERTVLYSGETHF